MRDFLTGQKVVQKALATIKLTPLLPMPFLSLRLFKLVIAGLRQKLSPVLLTSIIKIIIAID